MSKVKIQNSRQKIADILLKIGSVNINFKNQFTLTSGKKSPVYVDCRKLISFPRVRSTIMDFLVITVMRNVGFEVFDNIAGGETAGIPFAALVAERMGLPMSYIRKKPKGYGRNARIEGNVSENQNVLLVEDLTTDGGSKLSFVEAIRETGAKCSHTAVIFYYDIYKNTISILNEKDLRLHYLATWWDMLSLAKKTNKFNSKTIDTVEEFLNNPIDWSQKNGGN